MGRSRWQRVGGGLIGLWFAVAVPGVVFPVQVLDGGDSASGAMAGMPGMGDNDIAHCPPAAADHSSSGTHGGDSNVPARHHHHAGCDGACCTPATVTLEAGRLIAIPVVPVRVVAAVRSPTRDDHPQVAPQVTLPPPLGPPALCA
jgi:hypothetical protein